MMRRRIRIVSMNMLIILLFTACNHKTAVNNDAYQVDGVNQEVTANEEDKTKLGKQQEGEDNCNKHQDKIQAHKPCAESHKFKPIKDIRFTSWGGTWNRLDGRTHYDGTVHIFNVTKEQFDFEIHVINGSYPGEVAGTAKITDNKAVFEDDMTIDDMNLSATLTFTLEEDILYVEFEGDHMMYGGFRAYFDGEYGKDYEKKEPSLVELEVFKTEEQEESFKALVGEGYELFVNSFYDIIIDMDKSNPDINIAIGGVPGLYTVYEAIIMFSPDNKIWAAVLVPFEHKINYYTNTSDEKKLPEAIEAWKERYDDLEIVYK